MVIVKVAERGKVGHRSGTSRTTRAVCRGGAGAAGSSSLPVLRNQLRTQTGQFGPNGLRFEYLDG